jgi:hypothetical protein
MALNRTALYRALSAAKLVKLAAAHLASSKTRARAGVTRAAMARRSGRQTLSTQRSRRILVNVIDFL